MLVASDMTVERTTRSRSGTNHVAGQSSLVGASVAELSADGSVSGVALVGSGVSVGASGVAVVGSGVSVGGVASGVGLDGALSAGRLSVDARRLRATFGALVAARVRDAGFLRLSLRGPGRSGLGRGAPAGTSTPNSAAICGQQRSEPAARSCAGRR